MGRKGISVVKEPLRLVHRIVRAEHDVLGTPVNPECAMRQRPALGVSGTGVAGPSGRVPVTTVHPCMMADYSDFALGPEVRIPARRGQDGWMDHYGRRDHTDRIRLGGAALPVVSPARLYVCGITPYDVTHLGHASTFVWADAAASVLRLAGAQTLTCRNVTDVDDVLTQAAVARGRHFDEFALEQEYLFGRDMTALRLRRPEYEPRARHHVGRVVQLGLALLATGHAYQRAGTVYFHGADVPAKTGLTLADATELAVEFGDQPDYLARDNPPDDPFDVPVWRSSSDDQPGWPSPWGRGRPGWHAECAAIALGVLGPAVDILAGGADLNFPHHACQAAMVEAATGVGPFARATFPVGMVTVDGAKMAKSTGNLVLVSDLLDHYPAAAVRLLLLNRPWRHSWDFRRADIAIQADQLNRLYSAAGRARTSQAALDAVTAALVDDLDVPAALAIGEESGGDAARLVLRTLALE
jgi:L-cysteine:1D-myo-inositol 2-amino-2-deoxy-alpha-D-glucopyranoside ligase